MCGRYALFSLEDEIAHLFGVNTHATIPERYNIAPSQPALVVRGAKGGPELAALEWGLVPEWRKDKPEKPLINARAETVVEKPSFRSAMKRTRCLVPFNGWYEWKSEGGLKQPYFIAAPDQRLQAFAGVWTVWHGPAGEHWLETFAILTARAEGPMSRLHSRRPLVVPPAEYQAWLAPHDPLPRNFLNGFHWVPEAAFTWHRVDTRVNNVHFDAAECIAHAGAPAQQSLF